MEFVPGEGIIFYNLGTKKHVEGIVDCFNQISFDDVIELRKGDEIWVPFPESFPFENLYGYLRVTVVSVVLSRGLAGNHIKWKAGPKLSGKTSPYSGDFTRSTVHELSSRKRLAKIIQKHPDVLWRNFGKAATP